MKHWTIYPSAVGALYIECEDGAVTRLRRISESAESGERSELTDVVYRQVTEYLAGRRRQFYFPYRLSGTAFQQRVWKALRQIPYGQTRTYGEIAAAIGAPKAARAVGMANNKNPILLAIPCHRVIGANGKLVGYGCGLDMKAALLRLEGASFR